MMVMIMVSWPKGRFLLWLLPARDYCKLAFDQHHGSRREVVFVMAQVLPSASWLPPVLHGLPPGGPARSAARCFEHPAGWDLKGFQAALLCHHLLLV